MDGARQAADTSAKQLATIYGAFVVTLPMAAAIACGWLYQYGRATYFHMPLGVIRVQVSEICLALTVLAACFVGGGFVFVLGKAAENRQRFVTALCIYGGVITCSPLAINLFGLEERALSPALLTAGPTAFVLALALTTKDLRSTATHAKTPTLIAVALAFTFAIAGNFGLGFLRAWTQRYFYVVKSADKPDLVVLALYGDWLVLSPLGSDKRTLETKFILQPLSGSEVTTERIHYVNGLVAGEEARVTSRSR